MKQRCYLFARQHKIMNHLNRSDSGYCIDSSTEISHFARISTMINEQGTERIRQFVLDNLSRGSSLELELQLKRRVIYKLRANNRISKEQLEILYPSPGEHIDHSKIHFSLWYTLARNITVGCYKISWGRYEHNSPGIHDTHSYHYIIRLRNARNQLAHLPTHGLGNAAYNEFWCDVESALKELGTSQAVIDQYKTQDLDPARTLKFNLELKEEALKENREILDKEIGRKRFMNRWFVILISAMIVMMMGIALLGYYVYKYGQTQVACGSIVDHLPLGKGTIAYMHREGWGALPPNHADLWPTGKGATTIVADTQTIRKCSSHMDCCNAMKSLQRMSMANGLYDIAFDFLVGNDAVIYEGRGFNSKPATAKGWNEHTISLGFIGNYSDEAPDTAALDAAQQFLQYLASHEYLDSNFTIYGLRQVRPPFPDNPGHALYEEIKKWKAHTPGYSWSWKPRD